MTAIVLFLCALPGFVLARLSAVAPVIFAAALFAVPADEARADSGHPGGNYPLHCAAGVDNNLAAVIHLLGNAHEKNVNGQDADSAQYSCSSRSQYGHRVTPLHHAASHGHATIVATLIVAGADVNAKSSGGGTPLHGAAFWGHASVVSILIAAGADVNAKYNSGNTPLHGAADVAIVSMLIAAGANVHAKNNSGYTPLYIAARHGRVTVVSMLIAAGANANVKGRHGYTPLYIAAHYDHVTVVSTLIALGADANVKNYDGNTPLHNAARYGRATVAFTLIALGADVNARNDIGYTPLHRAVSHDHADIYIAIVSTLIAAGADVNAKNNNYGSTPLRTACRTTRSGICYSIRRVLIAAGGHWGVACEKAAVVNPAHYSPPCLCESPNVGNVDDCQVPSMEVCGKLTPAKFHDTAAGECVPLANCRYEEVRNEENNTCECLAPNFRVSGFCRAPSSYFCSRISPPQFYSPTLPTCASYDECQTAGNCALTADACKRGFNPTRLYNPVMGECVPFSADACGALTPPMFYDAEARRCVQFYRCHTTAVVKNDNSGCECPPGAYAHGDPATAECHADHAPINHDLGDWLDSIRADNPTLILHFVSQHDESPNQLVYAINNSAPRAIKVLIERGANVDQRDSRGDTPLHLATRRGDTPENIALVSLLLDKDANPNIRNNAGWRPLDLAYHGGNSGTWQARRKIMAALINGGANWSDECSGGAIPNENYRGEAQVAIYPQCRCPAHMSQRDSGGACECPAHSHSQVNGLCLPKDSAQVEGEIAKMQAELSRLRAELVSLNARISLSAEMPREMVEDIAEQARETAAEIDWRRANFIALGRISEAGDAPPPVALSDTAAECRMRGGEVRIDSGSGTRICLGLDQSGTFCLVDSGDVFSCRGLFKHVRRCNDVYHRPALNAFVCAARCDVDEVARGKGCE